MLYEEQETEEVKEKIIPFFSQHLKLSLVFKKELSITLEDDEFIVTYLPDDLLKEFLPLAIESDWKLGFLPHPRMIHGIQCFGVTHALEAAMENLLINESVEKVDMLLVNGMPVFDTVVVGECLSVMYGSTENNKAKKIWGKTKSFFSLFKSIQLHPYTFEYNEKKEGSKEKIDTAALGMIVVQHGRSSLLSRRILEDSYANDGMMHNLILAPESGLGLVKFGIMSLFRTRHNPKLPPFAAYIKTNKLVVKSPKAMSLSLDDILLSSKEVELEVIPKVITIVPGSLIQITRKIRQNEVFKAHALPRGDTRDELLKGPLPLINHATTDQFKELFTVLRENARPTSSYLVLTFLSTFIATLGLFADSPPVVIGAMILAPLMSPIISLSMGILRQDHKLIRTSLSAIGLGMLLGYLCAILITWLLPLNVLNTQILNRTRPNLLDLGIAVGSGIAGAYAHAKKEIAKTLAGVAIAVALIPPLAVSGIGAGWLNWSVFSGALLLLVTNLAGMVLAAAITFLFLGFSPFRLARKGLIISLLVVIGISAPLAFGFTRMVHETRIVQRLTGLHVGNMILREVGVRQMKPLQLSITIVTDQPADEQQLLKVKQEIERMLEQEVELEVTVGRKL